MEIFNKGIQPPGVYNVDVILNTSKKVNKDIVFFEEKNSLGDAELKPCMSLSNLSSLGVDVNKFKEFSSHTDDENYCVDFNVITGAEVKFDFYNQELVINIPQAFLKPLYAKVVDKSQWDEGISAAMLNYSYSFSRVENVNNRMSQYDSSFLRIDPGVNLGAWRFRNSSSWFKSGKNSFFQRGNSYVEKGLNNIDSRLVLGEYFTQPEIFSSVPFTGVYIGSDDYMVPGGQKKYSPVIKGTAKTNAKIEVSKNGYIIYTTNVPAGPFSLEDIPGTYGGELTATVYESDGQKKIIKIPFSTPAISIREGYYSYQLNAGKYGTVNSSSEDIKFLQAALTYGLPYSLTAIGGFQISDSYSAVALGIGRSLGLLGSLSFDMNYTKQKKYVNKQGASSRLRYNKSFDVTDTILSLSVQRFTDGFSEMSSESKLVENSERYIIKRGNTKSLSLLNIGQSLGEYGSLSVYVSKKKAFSERYNQGSLGANYAFMFGNISANIDFSDNISFRTDSNNLHDRILSFWISMPFGHSSGEAFTNASYQYVSPSSGNATHEVSVYGQSFNDRLNWNIRQGITERNDNNVNNSTLNATWHGIYGNLGGVYSYNKSSKQYGVDASGGLLIHSQGVTLSQPFGETISLVQAKGASGIHLIGLSGRVTDFRGYSIYPGLMAYKENLISLDSKDLRDNAEVLQTDTNVFPTKGAVVLAKFKTRIGHKVLLELKNAKGDYIPFGAVASIEGESSSAGVVDENGMVYLTGLPDKGEVLVKWGGESSKQCKALFDLSKDKTESDLFKSHSVCH
ncbi:TPA: fimbria/pilus outer membrane usher protein [Enterobacter asburiae]|nr:fimbria/pilus outer membrane usher protein [Enterobacter asburiae]